LAPFPYRILFVRHGQTRYNAENRLQGQRDIPLDALGREQASVIGAKLAELVPAELARYDAAGEFYASPLGRTRETMERARAAMGFAPKIYRLEPLLKELTFGDWEGLTWPEIAARDPDALAAREADKWDFRPLHGESYAMLAERVGPWLAARRADCFVVSHGGVARAFMALIGGLSPLAAENANIWQGRAIVFEGGGFEWIG
jgi:broad specificity phosphatase PhoE